METHIGLQLQIIQHCGTDETIIISKAGTYQFKLVDNIDVNNSNFDTIGETYPYIDIKTTNSPKEDVATITINRTDQIIDSYDYSENGEEGWLLAKGTAVLDNSTYIWVPRLAYKEENSEYVVQYLKGTTNIATDNTYINPEEYTISPVFTKANGTRITGIWLKEEVGTSIEDEQDLINAVKDLTPQSTNIIAIE